MKKNILISMLIAVFALGSFLVAMPDASATSRTIPGYVWERIGEKGGIRRVDPVQTKQASSVKRQPLASVEVRGQEAATSLACNPTTTNSNGNFQITCPNEYLSVRLSFTKVGYCPETRFVYGQPPGWVDPNDYRQDVTMRKGCS